MRNDAISIGEHQHEARPIDRRTAASEMGDEIFEGAICLQASYYVCREFNQDQAADAMRAASMLCETSRILRR